MYVHIKLLSSVWMNVCTNKIVLKYTTTDQTLVWLHTYTLNQHMLTWTLCQVNTNSVQKVLRCQTAISCCDVAATVVNSNAYM